MITGSRTGARTRAADVEAAALTGLPLVVGSGVSPEDAGALARTAQALIVGSFMKCGGDWRAPVDPDRVAAVRSAMG